MRLKSFKVLCVVPLFAIACADSVTEDFVAANSPPRDFAPFTYPTGPDRYENDNSPQTTGLIEVGVPQWHSLYPVGDEDWVRVELEEGIEYEFSASHLSVNGDTWLYLYDTDGATILADNDDCVGYESCIQYTPDADGVYYLRVDAHDNLGLMSYRLEARPFIDADNDGWSSFHDCDDGDANVNPQELDIAGDGVDQNCTGTDALVGSVPDAYEDDGSAESATALVEPLGMQYEFILRGEFFPEGMHTIHDAEDEDWYTVTILPHQMVKIERSAIRHPSDSSIGDVRVDVVSEDVRVFVDSSTSTGPVHIHIVNDSETAKETIVRVTASPYSIPPFSYLIYATPQGYDRDMDGHGTMGMCEEHDCDDTTASIYAWRYDPPGDGIDQNCDGVDGEAPSSMPREGIPSKRSR